MTPAIGTLDWRPARDHPELLAAPVAARLAEQELGCWVAPIDPGLADTEAFCQAYEVPGELSANCVVVEGRRGAVGSLAACLVLATHRADVNRTVRKHLDVRKISFAALDTAVTATGMEYGGITPIGLPLGWPVLVDDAVAAAEWGGGQRRPGQQDRLPRRGAGVTARCGGAHPAPAQRNRLTIAATPTATMITR